jgi:hypothetical protein
MVTARIAAAKKAEIQDLQSLYSCWRANRLEKIEEKSKTRWRKVPAGDEHTLCRTLL